MKEKVQLNYLRNKYEAYAQKWENKHDDRRLMVNMYDQLILAYTELFDKEITSPSIWCAFNHYRESKEAEMDEIISYFEGKTDRGGIWFEDVI